MKPNYSLDEKREFARDLRSKPTGAEAALWEHLRRKQIGYQFHRQRLIYGFIVDFWCAGTRLAIEVDGSIHENEDTAARDEEKELALARRAIGLLRFTNDEVFSAPKLVTAKIRHECDLRMQALTPLKGFGFDFRSYTAAVVAAVPCASLENRYPTLGNSIAQCKLPSPAQIRKSPQTAVEIPPEQRITAEDLRKFNARLAQLHRHTRLPFLDDNRPMSERAADQKYRLAQYLAKKQQEKSA